MSNQKIKIAEPTPTWTSILPALLATLEQGTPAGKKIAISELKKMATAADGYNIIVDEQRI